MKRLQVAISKVYAIAVPDDFDYTEPEQWQNAVHDWMNSQNMTEETQFYEHMKVVCSGCGISLSDKDEEELGCCVSCDSHKGVWGDMDEDDAGNKNPYKVDSKDLKVMRRTIRRHEW